MNGNSNKKSKEVLEQKRCDGNEVFLWWHHKSTEHSWGKYHELEVMSREMEKKG